jgi:non-ribosomal peptide synthetase component E (peptide arylation enzyme)
VKAQELQSRPFVTLSDLIAAHAAERGAERAIVDGHSTLTYSERDASMSRVALALQRALILRVERARTAKEKRPLRQRPLFSIQCN